MVVPFEVCERWNVCGIYMIIYTVERRSSVVPREFFVYLPVVPCLLVSGVAPLFVHIRRQSDTTGSYSE